MLFSREFTVFNNMLCLWRKSIQRFGVKNPVEMLILSKFFPKIFKPLRNFACRPTFRRNFAPEFVSASKPKPTRTQPPNRAFAPLPPNRRNTLSSKNPSRVGASKTCSAISTIPRIIEPPPVKTTPLGICPPVFATSKAM